MTIKNLAYRNKKNTNICKNPKTDQHGVPEKNHQLHLLCRAKAWKISNVKRVHGDMNIIGVIFISIALDLWGESELD